MANNWLDLIHRQLDDSDPFMRRRNAYQTLDDAIAAGGGGGGGGTVLEVEPFMVRTENQGTDKQIRIATQQILESGTVPEPKQWNIVAGDAQSTFISLTLKPSGSEAPTARGEAVSIATGTTNVTPTQQVDTWNGDVQICTVLVFPDTAPAPTPSEGSWIYLWDVTWYGGYKTYAYIRQTDGTYPVGSFSSAGAASMQAAILSIGGVLWPSWPIDQINSVAGASPPELTSGSIPATNVDNELYVIIGSFNQATEVNDPDGTFYPVRAVSGGGGGGGGTSLYRVFDVTASPYNADATGVSGANSAIQSAIDDAAVAGGIVYIPAGAFKLNAPLVPPIDSTYHVTVQGAGIDATTLYLTSGGKQAFQTYSYVPQATRYFAIQDFTVDQQGIYNPSRGAVWGTSQATTLYDISIKRIKSVNVCPGNRNIDMTTYIYGYALGADPAITVEKIYIEDCKLNGGDYGVIIQGFMDGIPGGLGRTYGYQASLSTDWGSPGTQNAWFDEIYIRRCSHDTEQVFYGRGDCVNFMIGGHAHVGKVRVSDCHGKNSFDDNFEFNSIKDLVVERCVAQDGAYEGFFHATLGGLLDPKVDKHVYIDCECRKVANNTETQFWRGWRSQSQGSPTAAQKFVRCKYTSTAPIPDTGVNAPFELDGEHLEVIDCSATFAADHIYTSGSGSNFLTGVSAVSSRNKGFLYVKGFTYEFAINTSVGGTASGISIGAHVIDVTGADMDVVAEDVRVIWNPTLLGTAPTFQCKALNSNGWGFAGTPATVDYAGGWEIFYLIPDAGTIGNLTITSGAVAATTGLGAEYRMIVPWGFTDGFSQNKFTPGTVAGHKGGAVMKRRDANNYIEAWVDGTTQQLKLDKVVNGTRTALVAAVSLGASIVNGTPYWIRCQSVGDAIRADYYTSAPADTISQAGNTTLTYTATVNELKHIGNRAFGLAGWSWIPVSTGARSDDHKTVSLAVRDFTARNWQFYSDGSDWATGSGVAAMVYTGGSDVNTRFRKIILENIDLRPWNGATGSDFGTMTATMLSVMRQARVKRRASEVPAPAALTVGASPYVYTNADGYAEDVAVYAGTVSAIEISRDGGTTYGQVSGATGMMVRLEVGDMLRTTYSVAPTMRKVPVL